MRNLKISVLEGQAYNLGLSFSRLFEMNLNVFDKYNKMLEDQNIKNKLEIVREKLQKRYPDYLAETYGRADGFKIDRDTYLLYICFEIYTKESCTDIVIKKDDKTLFSGHNEDLEENLDQMALVKYINQFGYYCELSTFNCPQGTTFGWNSNGIIYSVNSLTLSSNNEIGIPVWFILRDIVQCKNIDEIITKINIEDCASSFSLNIVDTNTCKAYSIEKVLDKLDVIEVTSKSIHTNHLVHPNMDYSLCIASKSSLIRYNLGKQILDKVSISNSNIDTIKKILQYNLNKDYFIYRKIGEDESPTAATFLYDSTTKTIQIYSYYDNSHIEMGLYE